MLQAHLPTIASMIVINAAMAHQLNEFKTRIDKLVNGGMEQEEALYKVLKETIIASKHPFLKVTAYSGRMESRSARRIDQYLPCTRSHPEVQR